MGYLLDFMNQGGSWMWAILAVAVLGAAFSVERAFLLYIRTWLDPHRFLAQVLAHVEGANYARALEVCNVRSAHPLPHVLKAGLMKANRREKDIERAMEEEMLRTVPNLSKRMSYIALFANISTLLGLIGTIAGLIQAFEGVSQASAAARQQMLAEGISVAMFTTYFGLIVAIPMMILHALFTARQERIVFAVEQAATTLMGALSGRQRPPG